MTSDIWNSLEFEKMLKKRFPALLKTSVLVVKEKEELSFYDPNFYQKISKIKQGNLEHKPAPEAVPRKLSRRMHMAQRCCSGLLYPFFPSLFTTTLCWTPGSYGL